MPEHPLVTRAAAKIDQTGLFDSSRVPIATPDL